MTGPAATSLASACGALWDVVVVGAGPAGALVSRRAALSGMQVLLVDRQVFPRDKVCGGCLSARTLAALADAGVGDAIAHLGGHQLHRLRLGGWGRSADLRLPKGLAISRRALDVALVDQAVGAGVRFLPGCTAELGTCHADRREVVLRTACDGQPVAARVVIDASGLGSGMLEAAPAWRAGGGARIGCSAVVEFAPATCSPGTIYMAVGATGYVGAVRIEGGRLNVAAAFDTEVMRGEGPGAAAQTILRDAGFDGVEEIAGAKWRGTPRLGQRPRRRAAERVFAVGDAAGYVEPFTGEGIGWAVQSAALLGPIVARAAECWSARLASQWNDEYRRGLGRAQSACRAFAWLLRRPALARVAISALRRRPELADSFVRRLQAARADDGGLAWP